MQGRSPPGERPCRYVGSEASGDVVTDLGG